MCLCTVIRLFCIMSIAAFLLLLKPHASYIFLCLSSVDNIIRLSQICLFYLCILEKAFEKAREASALASVLWKFGDYTAKLTPSEIEHRHIARTLTKVLTVALKDRESSRNNVNENYFVKVRRLRSTAYWKWNPK